MSSANRYSDLLSSTARFFLCVAVLVGLFFCRTYYSLPVASTDRAPEIPTALEWAHVPSLASHDWSVFQSCDGSISAERGSLARRFRLAGTFSAYGGEMNGSRKAILDEIAQGIQHIVGENEEFEDIRVLRIFRDRVVLRDSTGEEQLWLSFSRLGGKPLSDSAVSGAEIGQMPRVFQDTDRFGGKRIGESRWLFKREPLLDYYQQLMDHPDRLVAVFDSMKPVYDPAGKITGYRLQVEDEPDFFKSVGLNEGDVVCAVNSMQMTNRRRAEYFIRQFVQDRANVFVLDVERDGQMNKLIYQVR